MVLVLPPIAFLSLSIFALAILCAISDLAQSLSLSFGAVLAAAVKVATEDFLGIVGRGAFGLNTSLTTGGAGGGLSTCDE